MPGFRVTVDEVAMLTERIRTVAAILWAIFRRGRKETVQIFLARKNVCSVRNSRSKCRVTLNWLTCCCRHIALGIFSKVRCNVITFSSIIPLLVDPDLIRVAAVLRMCRRCGRYKTECNCEKCKQTKS